MPSVFGETEGVRRPQGSPGPSAEEVFHALEDTLGVGDATYGLVQIRRSTEDPDTAILIFRWSPDEALYGVPVSLTRIDQRLDWDRPADDLEDWLDSVHLWILEDVTNGFSYRGRRRAVDDYIELSKPSWPRDRRFSAQVNSHLDTETMLPDRLQGAGLDARRALAAQDAGTLLAWTFAYENNSTGMPIVGHSTIVHDGAEAPRLVDIELASGVPSTVAVELVRSATHAAAQLGERRVVATERVVAYLRSLHRDIPIITGFNSGPDEKSLATDFLTENPDLADSLLRETLAEPGQWGSDRDRAGRYLPTSRLVRVLHRIRHGRTGAAHRTGIRAG